MQVHNKEREIQRDVAATVEERLPDVEVLAAELSGPERLTVYIDHPDGVDHGLCEQVTDVLRGYLDRYTLDVSSPGLERPLRTPAHFESVLGRRAAIRTSTEIAGRKRFRGEVVAADDREVTLATSGGERVEIPYEAIARGNLIDEA
jgi:ribosome maturation factor RimP